MGTYVRLYFGPYLECTYKPKKKTVPVHGCTNTSCEEYPRPNTLSGRGNFCQTCGSATGAAAVEVDDRPDRYDVVGDTLHEMRTCEDDRILLAPNVRRSELLRPGDPREAFSPGEPFEIDPREIDHEEDLRWLEVRYAPEIEKLRAAYATVKPKWGLVQHLR
jgi:hypothetical protein